MFCKENKVKNYQINSLSETRWACRYNSIKNINLNFEEIKAAITKLAIGKSHFKYECVGILKELNSVKFLICLRVMKEILSHIHTLHKYLQSIDINLGDAATQIIATNDIIKSIRNETCFTRICENLDFNEISRKRHMASNLQTDFVVYSTIGHRDNISEKEMYFSTLFLPILDSVINEFSRRFNNDVLSLAKNIDSVIRLDGNNIDILLEKYSKLLSIDKELLCLEIKIASHEYHQFNLNIIGMLKANKYPNLYKLYCLCLTFPISSSTCERSFSVLRRTNNYLRSTMSDTRISDLSLLCIENDMLKSIPIKTFIDQFISKPRRLIFH